MNKSRFSLIAGIAFLLMLLSSGMISGQRFMMPDRILGWADDNNYLVSDKNRDGDRVVMAVNVRTGKKKEYKGYTNPRDELTATLPEGVSLGYRDPVSDDFSSVIFDKDNDLWYFKRGMKSLKRLTESPEVENNPAFSPDGSKIAFTRNHDLYVIDVVTGKETRLTTDGTDRIYNGWASWVYMEEILGRGSRYAAFWWSPDSKKLAFLHTDDRPVPTFTITRVDEQDGLHGTQEVTPYPKPGDPNPVVKMGIADVGSADITWVKTDESVDQYIAWPSWTPDSKKLMIEVLNRGQDDMDFILADAENGEFKVIYNETRDTWIDFYTDIYVMSDGSGFILRSDKSGWRNLYYYSWDGHLVKQLTNVEWRVTGISSVDEKNGIVYFTGTGGESTDNHFFSVKLDGTGLVRITPGHGSHRGNPSPNGKYIIDTWSDINTPTTVTALDSKGKMIRVIEEPDMKEFNPSKDARSELVRIPSTDGFMLPAVITYPVNFNKTQKYPVIFTIYGGPDAGNVRNRYMGGRPSWYAQNGIVTISVDHRSSGHFGKKGLDLMHRNLGKWEMHDYIQAVKWLREKPWVDASRMGITGSSYGGYTTAMALTYGADYWTHGIASSSVTDWRLYDDVYTERFMDTPEENPDGYKNGSVLTYTENLKGKLYIVHGTADDNVHTQNSIYLISKLEDEGKEFSMMFYPGGRHGWGGAKRVHSTEAAHKMWMKWFFGKED